MPKFKKITFLKALLADNNLPSYYQSIDYKNSMLYEVDKDMKTDEIDNNYWVQDIPDYLTLNLAKIKDIKVVEIQTLKGHVIELRNYSNINDYLLANFKSKNRNNLKRYQKKLETCFPIRYVSYYGTIEKKEYDRLFLVLKDLLIRRFNEKQEFNYELQYFEEFYQTVYKQILEKKANLFVIYDDKKPISIRINVFKEQMAYYILSGYDIDYSKFHLGSIDMLKNIEWVIHNKFIIYDLLKGYNHYKSKWASKIHGYHSHIIYNTRNLTSKNRAKLIAATQNLKYTIYAYYLKKGWNKYNRKFKTLKYILINRLKKRNKLKTFQIKPVNQKLESMELINIRKDKTYHFLRVPVYNYLYQTNTSIHAIEVFKEKGKTNMFLIKNKLKNDLIQII